jgi:hypothetical protein
MLAGGWNAEMENRPLPCRWRLSIDVMQPLREVKTLGEAPPLPMVVISGCETAFECNRRLWLKNNKLYQSSSYNALSIGDHGGTLIHTFDRVLRQSNDGSG